jgi:hypothetical protein
VRDEEHSQQIMENQDYIKDSIKCDDQEPIEVVLVFNIRDENDQTNWGGANEQGQNWHSNQGNC